MRRDEAVGPFPLLWLQQMNDALQIGGGVVVFLSHSKRRRRRRNR
jgi:hypothetical protein